jgi:hypothetical protein
MDGPHKLPVDTMERGQIYFTSSGESNPDFFAGLARSRDSDAHVTKLRICSCLQLFVANVLKTRNLMHNHSAVFAAMVHKAQTWSLAKNAETVQVMTSLRAFVLLQSTNWTSGPKVVAPAFHSLFFSFSRGRRTPYTACSIPVLKIEYSGLYISNRVWNVEYLDRSWSWFSLILTGEYWDSMLNYATMLSSTSFRIHYSLSSNHWALYCLSY